MTTDPLFWALLGGLLALDGTALGQFMVSRPLVSGVLAGWILGDPAMGLLVGGILEVYFIPVFPVGGADFPEGGPSALVGVVAASLLPGLQGVALGVCMGLLWSRLAAVSIHVQRKINGRLVPAPSVGLVSTNRVFWGHTSAIALDFLRGGVLTFFGVLAARMAADHMAGHWPLSRTTTLGLLLLGASVTAGAFVQGLGGWRKRGILFFAGFLGFAIGSYLL